MASKADIEKLFYYHAKRVWGESVINQITFTFKVVPDKKEMMSVAYNTRPKAIHNLIVRTPLKQTVYISGKLLKMSPEDIDQIVMHEVIHIGYASHNRDFRDMIEEYGGCITTSQLEGYGYNVQVKPRANKHGRFKTIEVFEDEDTATYAAREYSREHRDMRVRVQF